MKHNRSQQIRVDENQPKQKFGLIEIDTAILNHFRKNLKLKIEENEQLVDVPIMYASPENWKSIKKDGFLKDKQGMIQNPLIIINRTSISKVRDLSRNIDANNPQIYQTLTSQYTQRDQYDKFDVLYGRKPKKVLHRVVVPQYLKISYDCIMFTSYMEQMNKLIEAVQFSESSYWGDLKTFRFYTTINDFSTAIELSVGEDRVIQNSFSLNVSAFIISDSIQKELNSLPNIDYSYVTVNVSENIIT
jgi:hypothetical protein